MNSASLSSPTCAGLPANAAVLAIATPLIADAHQIDKTLIVAKPMRNFHKVGVLVADNDRLGMLQHGVDVLHHEPGDMRNPVEDEIAICAHQRSNIHVLVVDA